MRNSRLIYLFSLSLCLCMDLNDFAIREGTCKQIDEYMYTIDIKWE